jgi:hypothetical protein
MNALRLSLLSSLLLSRLTAGEEAPPSPSPSSCSDAQTQQSRKDPFVPLHGGADSPWRRCGINWHGPEGLQEYKLTGVVIVKGVRPRATFQHAVSGTTLVMYETYRFIDAELVKINADGVELIGYRGPCPDEREQDRRQVILKVGEASSVSR